MKDVRLVWRKHELIRSETGLTEASNYLQHQSSLSVTVIGEPEARCGSPVCVQWEGFPCLHNWKTDRIVWDVPS